MTPARLNPLLGVARLARGRPDGLAQFGDTRQAFLSSLAPLIAFSLVGAALMLSELDLLTAFTIFLVLAIGQLAPPVLSHWLAVRWGREEDWLRYATAFNWCQCLTPVGVIAMAFGVQIAVGLGLSPATALQIGFAGLLCYMLWLHWLVARHGLDLSRGRAAALVALVTVGAYVLAFVPELLLAVLNGSDG